MQSKPIAINAAAGLPERARKLVKIKARFEVELAFEMRYPRGERLDDDTIEDWIDMQSDEFFEAIRRAGVSFAGADWEG